MPTRTARSSTLRRRVGAVIAAAVSLVAAACTSDSPREPAAAPGSAAESPESEGNNSADRIIFWSDAKTLSTMTDAELDGWKQLGVDGFQAVVQQLRGLGGDQDFTADPNARLDTPNYQLQRALRDSRIVERARSRDMKLYLGFYLVNYRNKATPLAEWFDDAGWSQLVMPRVVELAGAAKTLGFAGLALDQELYPQEGNVASATWSWAYEGNSRTEQQTRDQARLRGQQFMRGIVSAFPDVELVAYHTRLPESWDALVQRDGNNIPNAFAPSVHVEFWDGIAGVPGYRAIRFVDAAFYKGTQVSGASWDWANQYNVNRTLSLFSRRWSSWSAAYSRVFVSPFSWVDAGTTRFEAARAPGYVEDQLSAFRKWGMGREFFNYVYDLKGFDYKPYAEAFQAATRPGTVDFEPPTVKVTGQNRRGNDLEVSGTATDNLGVRVIRWEADGSSGTLPMTWHQTSGSDRLGGAWEMRWTGAIPLKQGTAEVKVTAEDIKGLTKTVNVPVGG